MTEFAHPEALVSTQWVSEHLNDKSIRVVEVDVDHALYVQGHIEGAIGWDWAADLNDSLRRDILDKEDFEALLGKAGIGNDTTVILYGDANNWFAAWAVWQFKIYGHADVRLMDGGRKKWELEQRPYTSVIPTSSVVKYAAQSADKTIRVYRDDFKDKTAQINLIDVRSPDEFSGRVISPPGLNETAQRGGHIPNAKNVPWALAVGPDGAFKTADELKAIYEGVGVDRSKETVAYCRIGERSSHTWFVLKYLLGYENVSNYDGSWTEWGNIVGALIEK